MSADGQRTKWRRNIAENFNLLSRAHERYRQTDDRRTDDDIANVNVSSRSLKYNTHMIDVFYLCIVSILLMSAYMLRMQKINKLEYVLVLQKRDS